MARTHEYSPIPEGRENLFPLVDDQYRRLVQRILTEGVEKSDPQGVGNFSIHGHELKYDLSTGTFPLIGLRDYGRSWKAMVGELLWFVNGSTNTADLHKDGIKLWDQWVEPTQREFGYPEGELGPIYGKQWRAFSAGGGVIVDQLLETMRLLRENPDSRRIVISVWNPKEINEVFIAPCIRYIQFHHAQGRLGMTVLQGSGDVGVGVPWDTAQYALLLLMAAKVNGMQPGVFNHYITDAHIYKNQIPAMQELIQRKSTPEPRVVIRYQPNSILDFKIEDFELVDYHPNEKMNVPVNN